MKIFPAEASTELGIDDPALVTQLENELRFIYLALVIVIGVVALLLVLLFWEYL